MELIDAGPFESAGNFRVSATLYNASGAVPAASGGATHASSPAIAHVPSTRALPNQDVVTWHCGLILPGSHVDECSHLVLQVHCQKPSLLGTLLTHSLNHSYPEVTIFPAFLSSNWQEPAPEIPHMPSNTGKDF